MTRMLLLLLLCSALDLHAQDSEIIPDSERRALDSIFDEAGGNQWIRHDGWGGPRGTECHWYGITCEPSYAETTATNHVIRLALNENNLRGVIPDTAADLSHLRSARLWGNKLVRVPSAWRQREDLGELDLRVWNNPLEHRITEISLESAQGELLCAHSILKLTEDGAILDASIKCRNRTPTDRATYCEVRKASSGYILFQRLARFVETSGFYDLKRSYTVNQTHAGSQIVRVTRDGKQRTIDDYGYMEPLQLFGIELAIQGTLPSEWETTTRHPEAYCRQLFAKANNTIHTGVTYLVELPPDLEAVDSKYLPWEPGMLPVEQEIIKDSKGGLIIIESWVTKVAPALMSHDPLSPVTLAGRQALEHRKEENGLLSREVFFPVHDGFVHVFYKALSRERAARADQIIETIDEKRWD